MMTLLQSRALEALRMAKGWMSAKEAHEGLGIGKNVNACGIMLSNLVRMGLVDINRSVNGHGDQPNTYRVKR